MHAVLRVQPAAYQGEQDNPDTLIERWWPVRHVGTGFPAEQIERTRAPDVDREVRRLPALTGDV